MHDSAVSPCFHGFTDICHHNLLPHIPSICPSTVNSSPHPGTAPQSLNSSFQLLHLPGDLCPCTGYVWPWQGLSDSHSIKAATDQLFHSQPYMFLLWLSKLPLCGDRTPASVPPPLRAGPVLLTLLFSHWFLRPTEFCTGLYILFCWSGTPVHSQLVFCMLFCVWRFIPDVSMEKDVVHLHLLFHHLVLSNWCC